MHQAHTYADPRYVEIGRDHVTRRWNPVGARVFADFARDAYQRALRDATLPACACHEYAATGRGCERARVALTQP